MGLDINTKKLKKNAFRVSKDRGVGASRIRVPGGYLDARVLGMVQEIAQEYGNGYVHLTTRQGFEIEGIRLEDMDQINEKLQPIIELLEINQKEPGTGYPASGTRNISARQIRKRYVNILPMRFLAISVGPPSNSFPHGGQREDYQEQHHSRRAAIAHVHIAEGLLVQEGDQRAGGSRGGPQGGLL